MPSNNRPALLVKELAQEIKLISAQMAPLKIMHICGGHENAIVRSASARSSQLMRRSPLPCCQKLPCSLSAITYGCLQPAGDLEEARVNGGSVKVVYSPLDAIKLAKNSPQQTFVFLSVDFETTAAGITGLIYSGVPENLFFLIANRYTKRNNEVINDCEGKISSNKAWVAGDSYSHFKTHNAVRNNFNQQG